MDGNSEGCSQHVRLHQQGHEMLRISKPPDILGNPLEDEVFTVDGKGIEFDGEAIGFCK